MAVNAETKAPGANSGVGWPPVEFHESIDSTNTRCKKLARQGAPHASTVTAARQTGGRGRQGRPFSSPAGSGVYFSVLLRVPAPLDAGFLSAQAALAVCDACEELAASAGARAECQVKWPNDVYCRGKKVAGILIEGGCGGEAGAGGTSVAEAGAGETRGEAGGGTANGEAGVNGESEAAVGAGGWWYVVGIGINVYEPRGGWPVGLSRAGAVLERGQELSSAKGLKPDTSAQGTAESRAGSSEGCSDKDCSGEDAGIAAARDFLVGRIREKLADAPFTTPDTTGLLEAYRTRSILAGRRVGVECGNERFEAVVEGIDDDFSLRVRTEEGLRHLHCGEVHLHLDGADETAAR